MGLWTLRRAQFPQRRPRMKNEQACPLAGGA